MALVLSFDTAGGHINAALITEKTVLSTRKLVLLKGQSEELQPLLEAMLTEQGAKWRDCAAFGVGIGPGNFTGVRISVAFARGLSLGLGIPAIGVSTLESLAWRSPKPLLSVVSAPLGQLYAQLFYEKDAAAPKSIPREALKDLFESAEGKSPKTKPNWVTSTLPELGESIAADTGLHIHPAPENLAVAIAECAYMRLKNQAGAPYPRPVPLYLRAPNVAPHRERLTILP